MMESRIEWHPVSEKPNKLRAINGLILGMVLDPNAVWPEYFTRVGYYDDIERKDVWYWAYLPKCPML